jgi:hypothetical protein
LKSLATNAGESQALKWADLHVCHFVARPSFAAWRRTLGKKGRQGWQQAGHARLSENAASARGPSGRALQQRRQGVREQIILASMPPFLTHPLLQDYFLREKSGMSPCTPDPTSGNAGSFEVQTWLTRAHTCRFVKILRNTPNPLPMWQEREGAWRRRAHSYWPTRPGF